MKLLIVPLAFSSLISQSWALCELECTTDTPCYSDATSGLDCLYSIPFNKIWANTTVDVISQALENFGFEALYHSTGPPYSINLDIQGELAIVAAKVEDGEFTTDLDFQEYMQSLMQTTQDAHTRYSKPECYNAIFVQPFAFDLRVDDSSDGVENEPKLYLMKNIYTDIYNTVYPDISISQLIDQQVLLLNGIEFTTEISAWADVHETRSNNRGIRFNSAIRSYLYRNAISMNVLPLQDLSITLEDGSEFRLPWMTSYKKGLADLDLCAAQTSSSSSLESIASNELETHSRGRMSNLDEMPPQRLAHKSLYEERPDREVILPTDSPYYVSCFIQTVDSDDAETAGITRVLVMKVASFSPDGYYLDAWAGFLGEAQQCLSTSYDMIVVDVMQNGGGYVCLGLRLLELLIEDYENDHSLVQMNYDLPHSELMDTYIEVVNAPDPYPYPQDVEEILDHSTQESYPDGKAYYYPGRNITMGGVKSWRTNLFSLDCREAEAMPSDGWKAPRYMTPDKLIMLTDGTCGSTCASFTKIPQEHDKATFVGAGGIWDEGMDVSSFAGGFVCNPNYLHNIANWSGTYFPLFATNQRWQFNWALWYSAKLPSRPIQFTIEDPDYREAFWGFPHASVDPAVTTEMVSVLYDKVIASSIARVAEEMESTSTSSESSGMTDTEIVLTALCAVLGALLLSLGIVFAYFLHKKSNQSYQDHEADMSSAKPLL